MLSRRELLAGIGGWLGLEALALADHARGAAAGEAGPILRKSRIRSCVVIFHYGGPSHLDTWDPKPHAPAEIRGEFRPMATNVPGIQVSELLPMSARIMDKLALVRTVHHPMRNHNSAAAEALTGRTPPGGDVDVLGDDAFSYPCYGSVLTRLLGAPENVLPHVALPYVMRNVVTLPGQSAGFLGSAFERFQIEGDPNHPDFRVPALQLPGDVDPARLGRREALAGTLGTQVTGAREIESYYRQAYALLRSEPLHRALRIQDEPDGVRERYGRNILGQSVLLARRLVEAGVRYVTVFDGQSNCQTCNWDSHQDNFPRHRDVLVPPMDRSLSALVADLAERGRLDSTLVISVGEFGRTPRINGSAGRDHWPDCFSLAMAGGGIPGGTVWGASDASGAYPDRDPVSTGDLAATVYDRFGLDPRSEILDQTGRPHRLAEGQPLFENGRG